MHLFLITATGVLLLCVLINLASYRFLRREKLSLRFYIITNIFSISVFLTFLFFTLRI